MKHYLPRYILLIGCLSIFFTGSCEGILNNKKKEGMIRDLDSIKRTMQVQYAPFDWKISYIQWDIDAEYEKAMQKIFANDDITTKDFQQIVKQFLGSTQDYHVDATFYSTEYALLPFSIKTINGKCLVDWVDKDFWPSDQELIKQGDELLAFDDRSAFEVLEDLKIANGRLGNTFTDQALADSSLTLRLGAAGHKVPQGLINLLIQSGDTGEAKTYQLNWFYYPEKIASPVDFLMLGEYLQIAKGNSPGERLNEILNGILMINPLHQFYTDKFKMRYGELGASKSYLPFLGQPIWKYDLEEINQSHNKHQNPIINIQSKRINWFSYIYKNGEGHSIGYLRIPHYSGENQDFINLLPIIALLEKRTDALIIDQLNNSGGYVSFMYQILSLLSSAPLPTPKHQVAINQKEVMEAIDNIDELQLYQFLDENTESLSAKQMLDYYKFIIDEWQKGHFLTDSTHLGGVDYVQPHARIRYTKPILMLINELDFSAGDFMPAILQDSGRAILMGTPTAGAGGAVTQFTFPNRHGIKTISFTHTIAERINLQKIENLGVMPDIEYRLTEDDLRSGYQGYKDAINQAVSQLIKHK